MKLLQFIPMAATVSALAACSMPGIMTTNKTAHEAISAAIAKGQPSVTFGFDQNNSLKDPASSSATIIAIDDAKLLDAECHNPAVVQALAAGGQCAVPHTLVWDTAFGKSQVLQVYVPATLFRQPGYANLIMTAITAGIYPTTGTVKDDVVYCNVEDGLMMKKAVLPQAITQRDKEALERYRGGQCSARQVEG